MNNIQNRYYQVLVGNPNHSSLSYYDNNNISFIISIIITCFIIVKESDEDEKNK